MHLLLYMWTVALLDLLKALDTFVGPLANSDIPEKWPVKGIKCVYVCIIMPTSIGEGHYALLLSVRLSVRLSLCLSHTYRIAQEPKT